MIFVANGCIITKEDVKISDEDISIIKRSVEIVVKCIAIQAVIPLVLAFAVVTHDKVAAELSAFGSNSIALIGMWGFGIVYLSACYIVIIELKRKYVFSTYYKELLDLPELMHKYLSILNIAALILGFWFVCVSIESSVNLFIGVSIVVAIAVMSGLSYLNTYMIKKVEKVLKGAKENGLISETTNTLPVKTVDNVGSGDKPIVKVWTCDECGTENPNTSDYCKNCGQYK